VAELRCMKSYWEKEELDLLYVIWQNETGTSSF
jgi:hypothetical protein